MSNSHTENNYQGVREHLEFLGYVLDASELSDAEREASPHRTRFLARSTGPRNNFIVTYNPDAGFNFVSSYQTKPEARSNLQTFLELLNTMNYSSYLAMFSAHPDLSSVYVSAWYPDHYVKGSFSNFLDRIDVDIRSAIANNPNILNFIV